MTIDSIGRRVFLRWSGTGAMATTLLGACRPKVIMPSDAAAPTVAPDSPLATPGEVSSRPSTPSQLAAVCERTAKNIEGPFFRASAPFRASVVPTGTDPEAIFMLHGLVADASCKPLAGAIVEFWQADSSGAYDHRGFHMRTRVKTDESGRYALDTIRPGRYLNGDVYRPAHIHAKIHALGHRSLTTQLYFPKDPYNRRDPWFLPGLVMEEEPSTGRGKLARFDFYLGEALG